MDTICALRDGIGSRRLGGVWWGACGSDMSGFVLLEKVSGEREQKSNSFNYQL